MRDASRDALALRRRLSVRLRPLAFAIGLLISFGLPVTYYILQVSALRREAQVSAAQLATRLPAAHDVEAVVQEVAKSLDAVVVRVEDVRPGASRREIVVTTPSADRWWNRLARVGIAPVILAGETIGRAEVRLGQGGLIVVTVVLFVASTITGVGLGLLVYTVPVRVVGGMERRLAGLVAEQDSLIAAGRVLASSLDLRDVLDHLAEAARSLPGIDVVHIWLRESGSRALTLAARSGTMRSVEGPTPVLGRGAGLPGVVIESHQPIVIADVLRDSRLESRTWYEAEGLASFLGVPLLVGDTVLGVLACSSRTRREWSPTELTFAEALASLAAVGIRNATNFGEMTRRGERLRTAADLARAVSGALELPAVLREVVGAVAALRPAIFCVVRLSDPAAGGYRVAGTGGAQEDAVAPVLRFGEGLTHVVAESRRPLLVMDVAADPRTMGIAAQARQQFPVYYGVPIQSGETLLGVLSVSFPAGAPPSADEREAIEVYAGQAAVAIRNARLFEQSDRRRRAAEMLARVGRELSQALDFEVLAGRIQESVRDLLGAQWSGLYRYDPATGALVSFGVPGTIDTTAVGRIVLPRGTGAAGLAVLEGRPVSTPNVLTDSRITLDAAARQQIMDLGYRSLLAVPLLTKEVVVGALAVGDLADRVFTEEDIQLLQTFGDQATLALENALLYAEAMRKEREAEELARLARVLSESLEFTDVGERIVDSVLPLFEARSSGLYSLEADGSFRGVAWGGDARGRYTPGQLFPAGDGVIGWIIAQNATVVSADVLSDERFVFPEPRRSELAAGGNTAVLAVPLRAKGSLMGVLALADKPGRTFIDAELLLLQAFADQAALALENARHYQRAQQAYAELAEAQERLVRGETLRAMGELASGVAHHLNNLLAVVLGRVQLALGRQPSPEVARHLSIAERATLDGAEVVRRMRGFGRDEQAQELTSIDLNGLVEEIIELTRPRWEDEAHVRGVTIETTFEAGAVPPVRGEMAPLREVVMNLVINAVDAMPEGGRIAVRTWADDEWVHCAVADTGIGMSPEVRRRALEPFFTTKGLKSTGLGLSLNYGIIERLGGEMSIDSTEGAGTTVTFRLPVANRAGPAPAVAGSRPARSLRVLVIDDEREVRTLLNEILTADGHEVVEAASGADGLTLFAAQTNVDVVLTDLGMPGMTGWEVARAVKARRASMPVILITGWGDNPEASADHRRAADVVIAKPVTAETLRAALARVATMQGPTSVA
jgi:GAF domain-containing protein/ActR/RegA family two-component response regulator/anti-sigma regulatory factor (Ser/Thr protein kinase)